MREIKFRAKGIEEYDKMPIFMIILMDLRK